MDSLFNTLDFPASADTLRWLRANVPLALGVAFAVMAVVHPATRRAALPLVMAAAAAGAFAGLSQLREAAAAMVEVDALWCTQGDGCTIEMKAWLVVALVLGYGGLAGLGILAWYTARRILYVPADGACAELGRWGKLQSVWWPRIAGILPMLAATYVFASYSAWEAAFGALVLASAIAHQIVRRGRRVDARPPPGRTAPKEEAAAAAWRYLISIALLLYFLFIALEMITGGIAHALGALALAVSAAGLVLLVYQLWSLYPVRVGPERQPLWWGWLAIVLLTAVVLQYLATGQGVDTPLRPGLSMGLGTIFVACLGFANIIAIGSLISFWVARDRGLSGSAVMLTLLVWAGLLAGAGLSEQHHVWQLAGPKESVERRLPFERHLNGWLRSKGACATPNEPARCSVPLVVVSAQGGGIRAAYWTATTLAELEYRRPGFHKDVFAISAVSGSALGALLWHGALSDKIEPAELRATMDWALNEDFLASVVTGAFAPDLLARFVPTFSGLVPDRQRHLESAWMKSAGQLLADRDRPLGFTELVRPSPQDASKPALFLVALDGTSGRRWVTSDLCVDADIIKDAVDTLTGTQRTSGTDTSCLDGSIAPKGAKVGPVDLPAVTAAGLSARFPYVSPPGAFPGSSASILDGGLFESTGAATAAEILLAVNRYCRQSAAGTLRCWLTEDGRVLGRNPVMVENSCTAETCNEIYVRPLALELLNSSIQSEEEPRKLIQFPELLGPILALDATRSARGRAASETLGGDPSLFADASTGARGQLVLDCSGQPESVTLSWTISDRSRDWMMARLERAIYGRIDAKVPTSSCGRDDQQLRIWLQRLDRAPPAVVASAQP